MPPFSLQRIEYATWIQHTPRRHLLLLDVAVGLFFAFLDNHGVLMEVSPKGKGLGLG